MKIDKFGVVTLTGDDEGNVTFEARKCDFNVEGQVYTSQETMQADAIVALFLHAAKSIGAPLVETILMQYAACPSGRMH